MRAMSYRPYEDLLVGDFVIQAGDDRYPTPPHSIGDDEEDGKPPVAWWRSNLVGTSQRFNIYVTAFKDKVHVSFPRGIKQKIPSLPDSILHLPISKNATKGYLDQDHPHSVNNMKIGKLGNLEILLMACDDGDVLAYYMHVLNHHTQVLPDNATESLISSVKPFFHENVGISAWGLAIHEYSRMIAIGSNHREVTVFSFACSPFGEGEIYSDDPKTKSYQEGIDKVEKIASRFKDMFQMLGVPQERYKLVRQYANIAMPLDLGIRGHNIPSIDFISNHLDEATHVVAADIFGHLWYLDLDNNEKKYEPRLRTEPRDNPHNMGWGIINIPIAYFKRVTDIPYDAIGCRPSTSGLQIATNFAAEKQSPRARSRKFPDFNTPESSALLRTFNHDIQLLPPTYSAMDVFSETKPIAVVFKDLVRDEAGLTPELQRFQHMDRLNMYTLVPELSVVIIASQIGRVAVMTLTRLPDTPDNEPVTCIRRDAILPYKEHEKYRPNMPLLGMAVAPVVKSKPEHERWANEKVVFRLWLHYMDHTILSYELSRENRDELRIF